MVMFYICIHVPAKRLNLHSHLGIRTIATSYPKQDTALVNLG